MILLNSIVVVLKETIEAGILISVMLSISQRTALPASWWRWGATLGLGGALLYAWQLPTLTGWFEYAGQEVVNSALQVTLFGCVVALITQLMRGQPHRLSPLLAIAMGLAMIREGAEIVVFYIGVSQQGESLPSALTSGFVGITIGASVGALCYYLLILSRSHYAARLQVTLLALIASGMVLQASQLLVQIDWLPVAAPVWNSNRFLPEQSPLGQLAYAVFGYEATPSPVELGSYGTALLVCLCAGLTARAWQPTGSAQR